MYLLVFHVKRGGLGMVLGCVSPPLLVVVGIDEAYSVAGKIHLRRQVEDQKEHVI